MRPDSPIGLPMSEGTPIANALLEVGLKLLVK